jgi:hypothetical protein
MSKIITKKQLDLVVENTLKESGLAPVGTIKESKDPVEESVKSLVNEAIKEDSITEGLTNEVENFKRFINYTNY